MTLPYAIARCAGTSAPLCEHCRRSEPGDVYQWCIAPAVTLNGCPDYIVPLPTTSGAETMETAK